MLKEENSRKNRPFRGNLVRKFRVVKLIGILIVILIVSIQMFRLLLFDITAVNITNVG